MIRNAQLGHGMTDEDGGGGEDVLGALSRLLGTGLIASVYVHPDAPSGSRSFTASNPIFMARTRLP